METLRFLIKGQMIKKDPACPFNRMVAGSSNYYVAAFEMDDAWTKYSCLAKFSTNGNLSYVPIVDGKVIIPEEVLKYKKISVGVIGKKGDSILNTNETKIIQIGGI